MYDGHGVGPVFHLINDIITAITLIGYSILKFIYSYFSEIDYNQI